jgi:hypothetical protein
MAKDSVVMYGSGQWAIPNAMCYGIIRNGPIDGSFVENHITFRKGKTNVGHAPGRSKRYAVFRYAISVFSRAVRDHEERSDELVMHGFEPAHTRCMDQQSRVQHPPADRQNRDSRHIENPFPLAVPGYRLNKEHETK